MRLVNTTTGEAVRGRCRATNLCAYCARLFAVETSEMLLLDAMESAPTLLVVLTARELLTRPDCYAHLKQLRKSLRRRWPEIEWAVLVEFQRRGALHLNLLVKGVPAAAGDELHQAVARVWCSRVDAVPQAQSVTPVYEVGGAVRYVSQHFMKPSQAPPIGWQGHRYSSTRGYLVRPASEMREQARRSLRLKRALWRVQQEGLDAYDAELVAHELVARAERVGWKLVHLAVRSAAVSVARTSPDSAAAPERAAGACQRPAGAAIAAPPPRAVTDPTSELQNGLLAADAPSSPLTSWGAGEAAAGQARTGTANRITRALEPASAQPD